MSNDRHIGGQNSRDKRKIRRPNKQVKYAIVTDGEKTEKNYITGLKDSLRKNTPLSVKIYSGIRTDKLLDKCRSIRNEDVFSDYNSTKIWIVFDCDRVVNFDEIICEAKKEKYDVAWSNPCIEEWFWAYFSSLALHTDSVTTNNLFKNLFMTNTGIRYEKNLLNIYEILSRKGNEEEAICRAEEKLRCHMSNGITKPSEMYSATTVFKLVKKWRKLETDSNSSDE